MKNTINIDEELSRLECEESMQKCLENLAQGNSVCVMEYPDFGDINVKIIGLKLDWIYYRAIHVKILDKGLTKEVTHYKEPEISWGLDDEPELIPYKVDVPVTNEWVNVEWLKDYKKE